MDRNAARTRALMRGMHLNARLPGKLFLASLIALALPASAVAATPAGVTVKTHPGSESGNAVFTIVCGTTANPLGTGPDIPNTGQLSYTTDGPGEDSDYTKTTGSFNCSAATTSGDVSVPIKHDTIDEPDQELKLKISGAPPSFSTTAAAEATTTIPDDDVPTASIASVAQVAEGDSGVTNVDLVISLSDPSWQPLEVSYSTSDYNATAGSDYTAVSGTVGFGAGDVQRTITLQVLNDKTAEDPTAEAFIVTLAEPDASKLKLNGSKKQAAVIIFDNDKPAVPSFSLAENRRVTEGDSDTVDIVFTVNLSAAVNEKTQVAWKTADWTATHPRDYQGGEGILVFEAGETSKTITIKVTGDTAAEKTELFGVILTGPVGATLGQDKALGIIDDNDTGGGGGTGNGPKVTIGKPTRDGRMLASLLGCPETATACNGKLVATAGKLRVGRGSFELASGGTTDLTFKMSRKAFRELRKRALRVTLTVTAKDASGAEGTSTRTFRLARIRR